MDKLGFLPTDGGIKFDMHLEKLEEPAKSAMLELRQFALSLGSNVIEEVRPHRVVYAKTLTFRMFLDIEPAIDHLVVEVRSNRASLPTKSIVKTQQEVSEVKRQIMQAYEKIR